MSYFDPKTVHADIDRAVKRQAIQVGYQTIFSILQIFSTSTYSYWYEAACELHRLEKYYEALDCWLEAEKYISQIKKSSINIWYQDMVRTLINATDQSGDNFFEEQALQACIRACEFDDSEEIWNERVRLEARYERNTEKILLNLEYMLDKGYAIEGVSGHLLGIAYTDEVNSFDYVAQCYLERGNVSEALRIWSKAVKKDDSKNQIITCNVVYWLVRHADIKGLDLYECLPDNFVRVNN